ncbi:MAG TPA: hypothetical protein VG847_09115 [Chitinophagaceae bacterium]|nr:hypothetical protein [Chitinophagaceae bacterium]
MENEIRPVTPGDPTGLKLVLYSGELFPSEYLADRIADYLHHPDFEDVWVTCIGQEPSCSNRLLRA